MKSASKAFGEWPANFGISSEAVISYRVFKQVMFGYELTKKGKPYGPHPR